MAVLFGVQMTKLRVSPVATADPGNVDGTVRVFNERINLATQTTSDTIEVCRLPKGAIPLYGVLQTDTTLGAATIAIGITGTAGKYRAAAAFTATNVPTPFGDTANMGEATTAEEIVFITIATASLPASGILRVQFVYAFD